ncbi:MAG: hypothetical protein U0930_24215 [Pirellulales bacterium]
MPPSLLLKSLEEIFVQALDCGLSPAVAGGLAVAYWGHPRSTQDIDLGIHVGETHFIELDGLTKKLGLKRKKPQPTKLNFLTVDQWIYSPADSFVDIEVDFLYSDSSFHRQALERAVTVNFSGISRPIRVLTCEDLLLFKAVSGRLIDLADIDVLLKLQHSALDTDYLQTWSTRLGVKLKLA